MKQYLTSLPTSIRHQLLLGSTGKDHLLETARAVFAQAGQEQLLLLGRDLLLEAWLHDPLDSGLADTVASLASQGVPFPARFDRLAKAAAHAGQAPDDLSRLERAESAGDLDALSALLKKGWRAEPQRLFWPRALINLAMETNDFETALALMDRLPSTVQPLFDRLRGIASLLAGDTATALDAFGALDERLPGYGGELRAQALLRAGDEDAAMQVLRETIASQPWRVNAFLRLRDLESGRVSRVTPLAGQTAILLYSFNKHDELNDTLASLHASRLGDAIVRVLDNGSSDGTSAMLAGWRERFGPERFEVISLPVNVGAPQARNWLMSLPEVRQTDYAVYLDDDVQLPADWLERLGAAAEAYPDAGVWGAKVVDHPGRVNLQQVDMNLVDPKPDDTLFSFSNLQLGALDVGQFDYMRPTTSVTGCCHLFKTAILEQCGHFDVRYAPTQYDDLDHDLRLCLQGAYPVYTGHLTVGHLKCSGRAATVSRAASGNAFANLLKLRNKFTPEEIGTIRSGAMAALERDILG